MRPEHIAELAPVFDRIRRTTGAYPAGTIFEILLPAETMPGINRAGGHVVRHLDIPHVMIGVVV